VRADGLADDWTMCMMRTYAWIPCAVVLLSSCGRFAHAAVSSYTNRASWESAVSNDFTTIDFLGLPHDTFITDQYAADYGVTFFGENLITGPTPGFANDHWGLFSPNNNRFAFSLPQNWIAVDYPGAIKFQIFNQGLLIYTSPRFLPGGLGNFAGLVSDAAFDEVLLFKHPGGGTSVFVDDLHWGAAVPGPGVAGIAFIAAACARRRPRR